MITRGHRLTSSTRGRGTVPGLFQDDPSVMITVCKFYTVPFLVEIFGSTVADPGWVILEKARYGTPTPSTTSQPMLACNHYNLLTRQTRGP